MPKEPAGRYPTIFSTSLPSPALPSKSAGSWRIWPGRVLTALSSALPMDCERLTVSDCWASECCRTSVEGYAMMRGMGRRHMAEIAIIGAGITGLSIAYHLGSHGFSRVIVYEREGMGSGASGVAPGGVRRQWSTPVSCAMSDESYQFYRRINEVLEPGNALVFRECGYLFLAHSRTVQKD